MDAPDHRSTHGEIDLVSTLDVIEGQPLATRADAYVSLHDTLARRLEAAPGTSS